MFRPNKRNSGSNVERGQMLLSFGLMVGLFLLAFVGLATDYSNFWYHRQLVQSAADAACQAGAMDLMLYAESASTPSMNFVPQAGSTISCSSAPTAVPCVIAKYNGYDGTLASNNVVVSFPATIPGYTPPPKGWVPVPNIQVDITEQVPRYFSQLLTPNPMAVHAVAKCALIAPPGPVPIIALHPTDPSTINMSGTQNSISVIGGPQTSVQVNSSNANGVSAGSLTTVDLSKAGPSKTGGDFAVFGGTATKPSSVAVGTTGSWDYPIPPISDPYQAVAEPAQPADVSKTSPFQVTYAADGCPDPSGCDEYVPGYYPKGICVKQGGSCLKDKATTAIFEPGVYFLGGNGLQLLSQSIVRVTCCGGQADGDGSGGVMFFFSGTGSLNVISNSGTHTRLVDTYVVAGGTNANGVQSRALRCPGGAPNQPEIPATIDGNVLLAPCSGTYGDPLGQYRGF